MKYTPEPHIRYGKIFPKFTEKDLLQIENIDDIRSMHPTRFEWFCRFLLPYFGYESLFVTYKKGKYKADRGIDIEGKFEGERALIQCKRLNSGRQGFVPIEIVRELRGVMNDDVKRGAVVATLPFGKAAHEEAKKYHVELIGIDEIISAMKHLNPSFQCP